MIITASCPLQGSLSLRLTIEWEGPSPVSKYYGPPAQCFQTVSNCNSEKFSRSGPIIKQSEGAATVLGSIIFHQNSNKISTASNQPAPVVWPSPVQSSPVGLEIIISGLGGARQGNQQYFYCIKTIKRESVRGGENVGPATPMMKTKTGWREVKAKFRPRSQVAKHIFQVWARARHWQVWLTDSRAEDDARPGLPQTKMTRLWRRARFLWEL